MLPRRHLFFCLIALTALAGCKTKPGPTQPVHATGIGSNHGSSSGKQSARHAEPKDSATAQSAETYPEHVGAALRRDDARSAPPESRRKAAPTQPIQNNLQGIEPKGTNPAGQATASSLPTTTPPPRSSTVGPPLSLPAKPAPPAPVSLTVAPVAVTAPRPVARLTLAEPSLPTTARKTPPRPVSLSAFVTDTPTSTPAPARLSAVISAPSLADAPPTSPSLDLLSLLASPQATPGSQDQSASVRLPLATDVTRLAAARFDQATLLPLPESQTVSLQPTGAPGQPIPGLSERVPPAAPPPPPDSAAAREDREILHRKVYQFLLGQP